MCCLDEAVVADVRADAVLIRYIAWDHSFDEWVPRTSSRLAERGSRLLAHMSAKEVLRTCSVSICRSPDPFYLSLLRVYASVSIGLTVPVEDH